LIVFKIIEGQLAHSDVKLEVLMDDHVFPSYTSSKVRSKSAVFGDGTWVHTFLLSNIANPASSWRCFCS
jgi:hypothetical protein